MLFLVDANLPPALARALIEASHRAQHVDELDLKSAGDTDIWNYALRSGAFIVTKDQDFPDRSLRSRVKPVVIWLRFGNCRNRELLAQLMPILPLLISRIEFGDHLIEVE